MRLKGNHLALALGAMAVAFLAAPGSARATPQFAVVGQSLGDLPSAQIEQVHYRWGWHRPYWYPRYYAPWWRYSWYARPWHRGWRRW